MAIAAAGAYFHHVDVHSEGMKKGCGICFKPLDLEAVAHVQDEELHVFHKGCLFAWLRRSKSCPDCSHQVTMPPPFSYYYLFPDFQISCPNTEKNRETIAKKAAEVYSFFLTRPAHQGPIYQTLLKFGVMVEEFSRGETEVPAEQVKVFANCLKNQIKTRLKHAANMGVVIEEFSRRVTEVPAKCLKGQIKPCLKHAVNIGLEIIYSPHPRGILFEAFQRAKIDLDRYAYYLPRHTKISIRATKKRIQLMASFRWFANEEKPVKVELND